MNEIQLKLCDIQGRLFELSVDRQFYKDVYEF